MDDNDLITLSFTEEQIFNLYDILNSVLDEDIESIDNPSEPFKSLLSRETLIESANETMKLFDIVNNKIEELYKEENS
jgi:hypothetical protein